ncbi:MAG: hypothetical protein EA381_07600 [Planctomycetaceae bacterium]|nr:MAG: hypothetical protein EA381_07600 [Planctomycetaceae bacterium]
MSLCDHHEEARRNVVRDRTPGAIPIAVVGATGQGKSWLIRQFVRSPRAIASIPSGNQLDEATERLVWVGPSPPADLDYRHEAFVYCDAEQQVPVGFPYVLVDTPGSTDDRSAIAHIARRALSLAGVLILIVRRDQLRSGKLSDLAVLSEGAIVIPVVNAIRERDTSLPADIDDFTNRIARSAPTSVLAPVVLVNDFDLTDQSETAVAAKMIEEVSERIATQIARTGGPESRQGCRLSALDKRFRDQLTGLLDERLPGLTLSVQRLREVADALPAEIAQSLVGGGPTLRATIRSRLRAELLAETSSIWFPYRSLLGLLSLTSGAWDRLVLSLTGSLPSVIGTAWSGVRNFVADADRARELRDGLERRASALVSDRLGPPTTRFHRELKTLRSGGTGIDWNSPENVAADLAGIDALQETSQQIVDDQISRVAITRGCAVACCAMGTLAFWGLMSGPIIALYRGYIGAGYETLSHLSGDLSVFPRADLSLLLTSLLLSLLPTGLFAMLVITGAQGRRRVDAAETGITHAHREAIRLLQRDRVLRLRWNDPVLADAEFLLAIDRESTGRPGEEVLT